MHFPKKRSAFWCRLLVTLSRKYLIEISGDLTTLQMEKDPFVLVLNHNNRHESVLIPAWLHFLRNGRPLRFIADWPFLLVPGIASIYRAGNTIITTQKTARPRFLNIFKPLFKPSQSAFQQALHTLHAGDSVGIFPEGTINRHPSQMLKGATGASRLALTAQVPVFPVGIRFPNQDPQKPIADGAEMILELGTLLYPPRLTDPNHPSRQETQDFHARIMTALTHVSDKSWHPGAQKRRKK